LFKSDIKDELILKLSIFLIETKDDKNYFIQYFKSKIIEILIKKIIDSNNENKILNKKEILDMI